MTEWEEGHISEETVAAFLDAHPEIRCAACRHPNLGYYDLVLKPAVHYDPPDTHAQLRFITLICDRCSHLMLFRVTIPDPISADAHWVIPHQRPYDLPSPDGSHPSREPRSTPPRSD